MSDKTEDDAQSGIVIGSVAEYRGALDRVNALRSEGASPESHRELAALEGAIAKYVAVPGQPARRKGRPKDQQDGT